MDKTIVVEKKGYRILADVNPRTKRLYNFSISGPGIDKRVTYNYIGEAERVVNHFAAQKQ